MYVHRHSIKVRYSECDRMNIVYHSNYIIWFDIARTEFLRSLGHSYSNLEEEGIWLPVIEVGCNYKSPARYDDNIILEARIQKLLRVKITFEYKIYRNDELLAEGFSSHGFTSTNLKPIGLNRVKPELFEKLTQCIE